ncbi:undecaprenyl diphosphate synthase family protein [Mycobacterium marinum]|uniref:undecaprenyl diphosphate synthase family protein n=1 Tax=Mycobacterium marinum TaxID=1781 RepID=UPI0030B9D111
MRPPGGARCRRALDRRWRGGVPPAALRARDARSGPRHPDRGDRRLSSGFLWQSAYSELLFLDELWPDFTREHLENALVEFGKRVRTPGTAHREQSASTPDAQAEPGP